MTAPQGHPDRSGINRFGEDHIRPDYYEDELGMRHPWVEGLERHIEWSRDPRSEASGEKSHIHRSDDQIFQGGNMREHGHPRFENDDFSPYAGEEYHEKDHPGLSGKSRDGDSWINRPEYDEQRNFMGKGPRGYRRSDDRIYEEVCEALRDDYTVDASEIGVKVHEGIVTLEGRAHDRTEKRIAEMVALEVPGVLDVRNDIRLS